jgi:hypothetical protein
MMPIEGGRVVQPVIEPVARPPVCAFLSGMVVLALVLLGGCASSPAHAQLSTRSLGAAPVVLDSSYTTAVYGEPAGGVASILLTDVPLESLLGGTVRDGQIVHIELLWLPLAGRTPMDSTATNASIHFVVISGGEVGVYGGAGFVMPHDAPGHAVLDLDLYDATLGLLEGTEGFVDPLTPAQMTGSVAAVHDPAATRRLYVAASQFVTNVCGSVRFVEDAARHRAAQMTSAACADAVALP